MSDSQWTVGAGDAGVRLDKFLAAGGRLGSRPRAAAAIDRGKVFVNGQEAGAQEALKEQFKRREAERVYCAVVYGHPSPGAGTWRDRLAWDRAALVQKKAHAGDPRGAEAVSEYRVVEPLDGASLLEVRLVSGRRN